VTRKFLLQCNFSSYPLQFKWWRSCPRFLYVPILISN